MDKKMFLAVVLCAGIYFVWYNKYSTQFAHQAGVPAVTSAQAPAAGTPSAPGTSGAPGAPATSLTAEGQSILAKQAVAKTGTENLYLGDAAYGVNVSTAGGTVRGVTFAEYRGRKTEGLGVLIGGSQDLEITTPAAEWAYLSHVQYKVLQGPKPGQPSDQLNLSYDDANVSIQRSYTLNRSLFYVDQNLTLTFKKQAPTYLFLGARAIKTIPKQENERREMWFAKSGGSAKFNVGDVDETKEDLTGGYWAGFSSRYFLKAVLDRGAAQKPQFQARPLGDNEVAASLIYKIEGTSASMPVRLYYGPKEIDTLKAAGPHLDQAVDFGWFTVFAYPLLQALKWFYKYVHNFGIAIILLTIGVKLLTYPLTYKSMKSMKEMQRIQPQIQKLRERYKDDKEKLNKEMLTLMKTHGYNPMSGCLPIFIQMPIFIALYNVLYGAIDLYGQPFFGWIHDLSAKDPFYVTPVLLGAMMFVQQKLTPNTASDPAQQRMMMMMPVIFGFMMLWLPSGLTLYMLVNSVVSIIQQMVINRKIGGPRPVVVAA